MQSSVITVSSERIRRGMVRCRALKTDYSLMLDDIGSLAESKNVPLTRKACALVSTGTKVASSPDFVKAEGSLNGVEPRGGQD